MRIFRAFLAAFAIALGSALASTSLETDLSEKLNAPGLSVVHLWAPWCSNCQAELKTGGWLKMVKDNPETHFYFITIWNNGEDGRAALKKFEIGDQPNVTIVADPGPRSGDTKLKSFLGLPVSWIPTTWIFKGGNLRYAMNYGEVRFIILQRFLDDSVSEWSHKGE